MPELKLQKGIQHRSWVFAWLQKQPSASAKQSCHTSSIKRIIHQSKSDRNLGKTRTIIFTTGVMGDFSVHVNMPGHTAAPETLQIFNPVNTSAPECACAARDVPESDLLTTAGHNNDPGNSHCDWGVPERA